MLSQKLAAWPARRLKAIARCLPRAQPGKTASFQPGFGGLSFQNALAISPQSTGHDPVAPRDAAAVFARFWLAGDGGTFFRKCARRAIRNPQSAIRNSITSFSGK